MNQSTDTVTSFPLKWPAHKPRCERRGRPPFRTSFARARDGLLGELRMLGANDATISSNIPVRMDGLPRADARPVGNDPGIACYFTRKGRRFVFACDAHITVEANMHAIGLTIGALRGIARWGTGDMMETAISGFAALPEKAAADVWYRVLGVSESASPEDVRRVYRELLKRHHPDTGGDVEQFHKIQEAIAQFDALQQ